jgi:vacuolar-type H+-ATPase subunit H
MSVAASGARPRRANAGARIERMVQEELKYQVLTEAVQRQARVEAQSLWHVQQAKPELLAARRERAAAAERTRALEEARSEALRMRRHLLRDLLEREQREHQQELRKLGLDFVYDD